MPEKLSKSKLSHYRKFLQKKTRESEGLFLIEGWHLLEEALEAAQPIEALVYDPLAKREPKEEGLLQRVIGHAKVIYEAEASQLAQLSDTKSTQGLVALTKSVGVDFETLFAALPAEGPARLVLLDEIGDPGNCGAIVRACDWFGMDGVLFGVGCAELENGKTARATMGGIFHLPIAMRVELSQALERLRQIGIQVFTTELDSTACSLDAFSFPERCALVLGNEARGVSARVSERANGKLFIPKFGKGESLNAAAAAAVCLAKWRLG